MPRPPRTTAYTRLNLELPAVTRERMERLRVATEADSLTEVIRRALRLYDTLIEAHADEQTVIIRARDGAERQVVLP